MDKPIVIKPRYVNKKNETIYVEVTGHAHKRFKERYPKAYGVAPEKSLAYYLLYAEPVPQNKLTKEDKKRIKRRKNGTLFLKNGYLKFVVSDKKLITVELCGDKRHLNRKGAIVL